MRAESIELVTQYKDGVEIKEHTVKIFAKKKSTTRSEFYAAYGVGLRPQYVFSMMPAEFKLGTITVDDRTYSATHIRHKGVTYEIVRTYQIDNYSLEVTVK